MVLHLVMNSFKHGSRILKECNTASQLAWQKPIMVIALWEAGFSREERLDAGVDVWRVALRTRNWPKNMFVQSIKYFEWMFRIVTKMRKQDLTVLHAHNVSTLPIAVVLKWMTGVPIIYDAHELESRTHGLTATRSRMIRWIEGLFIGQVDRTITVCDSIADWYADEYPIKRPVVVRNVPMGAAAPVARTTLLREEHNIPVDAILYLYQGLLSTGRGLEDLIEVFAGLDTDSHLVIMGYGELEQQVQTAATSYPKIHFQPAVHPDEVLLYTSSADVGLCLIENTCLSYYYSLPNKLFEYLLSGLPVLVNDMPEQRHIVEEFGCGWIAPESLAGQRALIESINMHEIETCRVGAKQASGRFRWEIEAERLQAVYTEVTTDA